MAFEIVEVENGEVLGRYAEYDEATARFGDYIAEHSSHHVLIEDQVMLVEVREDGEGHVLGRHIAAGHGGEAVAF